MRWNSRTVWWNSETVCAEQCGEKLEKYDGTGKQRGGIV